MTTLLNFFHPIVGACEDDDENCVTWAEHGFCEDNPGTALVICKKSCNACSAGDNSKLICVDIMSHDARNLVYGVSDQVQHKPGCTALEDDCRTEISDLGRRLIVLSM